MPLGACRTDQIEVVVGDLGDRELAEDLAVGQQCVGQRDAAGAGQLRAQQVVEVRGGARPLHLDLGEARHVEHAHPVADGVALLGHRPAPRLGAEERVVVDRHGAAGVEPGGALPAASGAEVRALGLQGVVQRRHPPGSAGGPFLVGEAHRVLVLIELLRLGDGVVGGGVVLVAAAVPAPHVVLGPAVQDPLRGELAGAAALGDAEAERVAVEEVAQAALGPEVRVAVGCVGDGPVHHSGDAGLAQHGHALTGIEDLGLEALEVLGPEHVGELLGNAVEPHRGALPFVRPEDVAVAFLTQVVAGVGVAQQRQGSAACRQFGDLVGDVVLVRHLGDGMVTAEQLHHLAGAVAGGVDDDLAVDGVLLAVLGAAGHRPVMVGVLLQADHAFVAADAPAHVAGAGGQGLGDLRGVDVAVERVPQRTHQVVRLDERVDLLQLRRGEHVVAHALGVRHRGDVTELGEALVAVSQAHRTGHVVVDGELLGQFAVEGGRVALRPHGAP